MSYGSCSFQRGQNRLNPKMHIGHVSLLVLIVGTCICHCKAQNGSKYLVTFQPDTISGNINVVKPVLVHLSFRLGIWVLRYKIIQDG